MLYRKLLFCSMSLAALVACSGDNSGQRPSEAGTSTDAPLSSDSTLSSDATDAGALDSTSRDSGVAFADVDSGNADEGSDGGGGDGAIDAMALTDAPADHDAGNPCPADGGIPAGLPDELRCTGLYSDWTNKTVAPDVMPYTPGVTLWSDGAAKTRWIWLPPGTKIDTTDMDDWVFPVGTKVWKQFDVGGKTIETRLIWKQPDASWISAVYRWSADGSSTYNLVDGETNVNGSTYEVPATYMCTKCHQGRKDFVLGFDLIGTGISTAQGTTLANLLTKGLLTRAPPSTKIVVPEDATQKAAPALAWIHMNCGVTCHSPNLGALGGYSGIRLKLLTNQLFPEAGVAKVGDQDTYVTNANMMSRLIPNGHSYLRIAPGNSAQSLLTLMTLARAPDSGPFDPMPPLVSHVADTADVRLIQAWIDALPPGGDPP
jgi:hypothetical protein